MGREVKRVPPGFDWPLEKVWGGFVNPFYRQSIQCPDCDGSGSSPEARHLKDLWYGNAAFKPEDRGSKPFLPTDAAVRRFAERNVSHSPGFYGSGESAIHREAVRLCALFNSQWSHHLSAADVAALIDDGRLMDFTHTWKAGEGWKPNEVPRVPTPEEVNVWSISGFGHDSINQWIVVGAECKRLGRETGCKRCSGEGQLWPTPEIKQAADSWEQTEPPVGDGWQVWETVSEGSPVTPAFATRDELIAYLVEGGDAWDRKRGDGGWTRENAESFIDQAWAPTLITSACQQYAPRDGAPA